jgi:hypothetical protein
VNFEDVVVWLAQQMNTTRIAELMAIGWARSARSPSASSLSA